MKTIGVLLALLATALCPARLPEQQAASETSWQITIASKEEPGEPLIVSGVVYGPDGATPLAAASVYVYHTDVNGNYNADATGARGASNPRLRGSMRTDDKGRYEFRTIKPGPYPSAQIPAHIHYVVRAAGHKEKNFEIVFEGDPFITDRIRADARNEQSIYSIRPLSRDGQGVLRCVQDVKLQRAD